MKSQMLLKVKIKLNISNYFRDQIVKKFQNKQEVHKSKKEFNINKNLSILGGMISILI